MTAHRAISTTNTTNIQNNPINKLWLIDIEYTSQSPVDNLDIMFLRFYRISFIIYENKHGNTTDFPIRIFIIM